MDLFDYVMQTPANTNPAVLSSEISKAVEESQVQADYAQNDPNAKDYIKNRPFYGKKGTRLRNTIKDFYNAGGDFDGNSDYSMTFIVNGEILSGTCSSFDSGQIKIFYLPSSENYKYVVRALSEVHTGTPSISCETADGTIVENWSIYPPEETEEIHYLDPKYIEDMYYTEKESIVENLGNTYDVWDKICTQNGAFSNRDDVEKAALSFIIEGNLYKHIVPRFFFHAYVYNYVAGEYEVTVYENNSQIKCFAAGKEVTNWQIVSVSDKVHHLDSKYLDPGLLARIEKLASGALTVHVTDSNGTLSADKSYIEIMDAILAGTTVLVDYGFYTLPLIGITDHNLFFGATMCDNDDVLGAVVATLNIQITKNNEVNNLSTQINIPSALPNQTP